MLGSGNVSQQRQMENSPLGLSEVLRAKKLLLQMISYVDICSDVRSKMVLGHLFQTLFPGALKFKESALGTAVLRENKGKKSYSDTQGPSALFHPMLFMYNMLILLGFHMKFYWIEIFPLINSMFWMQEKEIYRHKVGNQINHIYL